MAVSLTAPEGYGYTVIVALGIIPILSFAQGVVTGSYRKPAKIPYPNAYATPDQVKNSKEAYQFNCAQRAHANLLENLPQVMVGLLFSGLFYERATPLIGLFWVVSRIAYAYGYITSDKPHGSGRFLGGTFWLAQMGIIGLCVSAGLKLI